MSRLGRSGWIAPLLSAFALALCASAPAQAQSCVPLYELEMKKLLDGTYEVLESADPDLKEHATLIGQIETRLPCADFEVTPELWSRYLVSIAVREHYQGGDWEEALTTARRLDPDLQLPVREGHPLTLFEPAPEPASRGPLPDGIRMNKDGLPLYDNVPLDALHLLQRSNGEAWETLVVHGPASIPPAWLKPPPPPPSVRRARRKSSVHTIGSIASGVLLAGGGTALAIGLGARGQALDPESPDEDRQQQIDTNNEVMPVALGLLGAAGVGFAVTWAVPW